MFIFKRILILLGWISLAVYAGNLNILDNKWSEVKPIIVEENQNLTSIKIQDEGNTLDLLIEGKNIGKHTAVYIDIDNNPKTGYQSDLWANSGMDYLIEDNRLYQSVGKEWGWEYLGKVSYQKNYNYFLISLDKNILDNMDKNFKLGVTNSDEKWHRIARLPSSFISAKYPRTAMEGSGFSYIRSLISQANDGILNNVTYICVGDSTRANDSYYGGGYLFDILKERLSKYNVHSYLQAVAGYTAKEYNRGVYSPNWMETVFLIPNRGETSIVDISLGINDARYYAGEGNAENIKNWIKSAMDKILEYRPKTTFMLTMPNKLVGLDNLTQKYQQAYLELSNERNIPLVNTISEIFNTSYDNLDLYRGQDANDYGANIRIHLSKLGQEKVANLILSKILPQGEEQGTSNIIRKNNGKYLKKMTVEDRDDVITFFIETSMMPKHIQVLIDSDNESESGYKSNRWENSGIDYLIEDGRLYESTGTAWGWRYIETVRFEKIDNNIIKIDVPKRDISNLRNTINVGVNIFNESWLLSDSLPSDNELGVINFQ